MDVFDALGTARAMRWLKRDPVSDELIEKLIWAGTRASSAHNSQPVEYVVVREPSKRRAIAEAMRASAEANDPLPPNPESRTDQIIDAGVRNLFTHMDVPPVLIFVCAYNFYPPPAPNERFMWAAVYAAAQNLIVAARALELGAAHTMLHFLAEPVIREILSIPDEVHLGVTIPIGWPDRPFGPIARKPVAEVIHGDSW